MKTFTLQSEAVSSDGQDSSEEAELKRKKIEAQKVRGEWEEVEVTLSNMFYISWIFLYFILLSTVCPCVHYKEGGRDLTILSKQLCSAALSW